MPKILVVDDEVHVLGALKRLLIRSGFQVETAGSGPQALEKLAPFAPDIVLSDFRMPEMNGAQLLAAVKERWPQALRIMISGYADLGSVTSSVNEGEICRFVSKPWDDATLGNTLLALVHQQSTRALLERTFGGAGGVRVSEGRGTTASVELRFERSDTCSVERAVAVISRLAGVLEEERLAVISGLLQRHGGTVTFSAQVGGQESLTVALGIAGTVQVAARS